MDKKKDLEETIKDKVVPLLEETMEKQWGITIPKLEEDISDKLKHPQIQIYIPVGTQFKEAKKKFKSEFIKRELRLHKGNISNLAKFLGIDRRSVHRAVKELGIDVSELRVDEVNQIDEDYQEKFVDESIRSALEMYKELIRPQQMEKMYKEVSVLSKQIAKFLPHEEMTLKEAEKEFEKQFLEHALKQSEGKISVVAKKIGIRVETLHRKVKNLGLLK